MPKPLTQVKARGLLNTLFPRDRIHLDQSAGLFLVYLNSSPQAQFSGPSWDSVVADAARFTYNQNDVPTN